MAFVGFGGCMWDRANFFHVRIFWRNSMTLSTSFLRRNLVSANNSFASAVFHHS